MLPIAFFLTAFIGLTEAILVGVVLGMFFFVKRMADATEIERHANSDADRIGIAAIPAGVEVYSVRGPFFFAAATLIRDLDGATNTPANALILRLGSVPFIDATVASSLRELATTLRRRGGRLLLAEADTRVRADLASHNLLNEIGHDAVFTRLDQALASLPSGTSTTST